MFLQCAPTNKLLANFSRPSGSTHKLRSSSTHTVRSNCPTSQVVFYTDSSCWHMCGPDARTTADAAKTYFAGGPAAMSAALPFR